MNKEILIQILREKHKKNLSHFSVIEYINYKTVITKNKYGICKSNVTNLIKGKLPGILTAINKTEYFINQAKEIHGDKYDYSKTDWIKSNIKIIIICPIHGEFFQTPNGHLIGSGCNKCGTTSAALKQKITQKKFEEKSCKKHNNKYDYSKSIYKGAFDKIEIICPIHGSFFQAPSVHLFGCGCPKCKNDVISKSRSSSLNGWNYKIWEEKGLNSKRFDSFKVYILYCWNNKESFYKIGKTFLTLKNRYPNKNTIPYNYKIIKIIEDSAINISKLENDLKNQNKKYSYLPKLDFGGKYECFSKISQN